MNEKCQVTLQSLHALVKKANHHQIPSTQALVSRLFQCKSEATIFTQLLSWMPHSVREDGAVYKSAAELALETGYSTRTIERALAALRRVAFDTFVRKASGAPTTHYILNLQKLFQSIANVFSVAVAQVKEWLFPSTTSNSGSSLKSKKQRTQSKKMNTASDDYDIKKSEFYRFFNNFDEPHTPEPEAPVCYRAEPTPTQSQTRQHVGVHSDMPSPQNHQNVGNDSDKTTQTITDSTTSTPHIKRHKLPSEDQVRAWLRDKKIAEEINQMAQSIRRTPYDVYDLIREYHLDTVRQVFAEGHKIEANKSPFAMFTWVHKVLKALSQ